MKVILKSRKASPFTNDDGEEMQYFWYKAERLSDNVTIRFGSQEGGHVLDEELDLDIEKYERDNGKIGYKETKEED